MYNIAHIVLHSDNILCWRQSAELWGGITTLSEGIRLSDFPRPPSPLPLSAGPSDSEK